MLSITPRKHQSEAIEACIDGLRRPHSRGQCIMACGTGKTLVGYEVAQGLKARRVLALVPSLLLVQQMIREYRVFGAKHILAVCSDDVVSGEDAIQVSVKELDADVTTDAKRARAFLTGKGQRIVVCTYQSLRSLSAVFEKLAFDLAIFDEAHKTAGHRSKLFAHGLSDDSVKCARRLFLTATPRHAALKEDGSTSQIFAMNDPKIYGPVLYSLPLRAAIEAGIIDDYRIIIAVVPKQKTDEFREQAIRVAIDRAMRVYGIRKVFTFHARVADAGGFILGATDTLKGVRLYHVNGEQSGTERGLKLKGFAASEAALMSNARCLTEGVDLPAADMVAFLSPKKNAIDIVQAVGRVLRKHHAKAKGGYVFLPVFVREGEDEEAAIAESDWSGVYEVLQAMREQDEPLAVALAKAARGEAELPEKISVMRGRDRDGPEDDRAELSEGMRRAIRVKTVRPFRIDPDGKRKELIALAKSGAPRPLCSTILGQAFMNYRSDSTFMSAIETLAPSWVLPALNPVGKDKALLQLAMSGGARPHSAKDPLGVRLSHIKRTQGHPTLRALRDIRPDWFDAVDWEKRLMELAKSGAKRPARDTPEGVHLRMYMCRATRSFRPELQSALKAIAPHWWMGRGFSRTEQGKPPKTPPKWRADKPAKMRELERLAAAGAPRPMAISKQGQNLRNYTRPYSTAYEPKWTERMRRIAPHWFPMRGELSASEEAPCSR